ncbi:MAG: hypothetical protein J6B26_08455 [Agathobacter sp.]|nr:hypothetical protein [Agathobacter sp.]MBQ2283596.1 hypothetical protein [Agathobacter sp.]
MKNPAAMMKIMGAMNKFKSNHPKLINFFQVVFSSGIPEGTVLEITVTKPGQEPMTANMKVLESDLELMEELKNMQM